MAQSNIKHDHFSITYRADCITCEKYVGPKRKSKQEAEEMAAKQALEKKAGKW